MKANFNWNWKVWRLIPTVGVWTRANSILIAWLCVSIWIENSSASRTWCSKHCSFSISHSPTNISLPSIEVGFSKDDLHICAAILGFRFSVRYWLDDDLPF